MGEYITDEVNKLMNQFLGQSSSPRFRYYEDKRGNWYAWTTERTRDPKTNKQKFATMKYRHFKGRKEHRLVKVVYFNKRKMAKARALKWYKKATTTNEPTEAWDE